MSSQDTVRHLDVSALRQTVADLLMEGNYRIAPDILEGLRDAARREQSDLGRRTLEQIVRNYEVGAAERLPVCQDSGMTVVMLETGQDVHWTGGSVYEAVNQGVSDGTRTGYLHASVVDDPFLRKNTVDWDAGGDPRGPGARRPRARDRGVQGVRRREHERHAHADPGRRHRGAQTVRDRDRGPGRRQPLPAHHRGCGRGQHVRRLDPAGQEGGPAFIDVRHARPDIRALEDELLDAVNAPGIGPQGFGGVVTALAVNVEVGPTHIAGLPVAVNIGCHSNRRMSAEV